MYTTEDYISACSSLICEGYITTQVPQLTLYLSHPTESEEEAECTRTKIIDEMMTNDLLVAGYYKSKKNPMVRCPHKRACGCFWHLTKTGVDLLAPFYYPLFKAANDKSRRFPADMAYEDFYKGMCDAAFPNLFHEDWSI